MPWTTRRKHSAELVSPRTSSHPGVVARSRRWPLVVFALLALLLVACKEKKDASAAPAAPPVVTDSSADLLFTWIDEKGEFHVEQRVAEIPEGAREIVRVVAPVGEDGSGGPEAGALFVVDLTSPVDGVYPVRTMPRGEFEEIAVERRKQHGGVLTARAPPVALPDARPAVIIYGAPWCGPCHEAAAFLKERGITFVEKNVEADGSAAREMQAKLATAGIRGGSIPVLDVRGKVLVGFDRNAVEVALGQVL